MKAFRVILFFIIFGAIVPVARALDRSSVAGNYELQGVMEMAGGLSLGKDGKYLAGFSYGAADWVEEGTWAIEGAEVVLSGGRFKERNYDKLPLFLPPGTRLQYRDGKLSSNAEGRKIVFINPDKTPSGKGGEAGEGRMKVEGKLLRLDAEVMVIDTGECLTFDSARLPEKVRKAIIGKIGRKVEFEIPYSAILSSGSCN